MSPIIARVTNVINWLHLGDVDRAVTGRASILDSYLYAFKKLPIVNKLLD